MASAATTELYSTYKTYLMAKTGSPSAYAQLCNINNYSDVGGAPETIDMTSLSDPIKVSINGIQGQDAMTFEVNYNPTVYSNIKAYQDEKAHDFALYFGATISGSTVTPDGSDGKFEFSGTLSVWVNGGNVNEGRKMTISIAPSKAPLFTAPS